MGGILCGADGVVAVMTGFIRPLLAVARILGEDILGDDILGGHGVVTAMPE